MKNYIECAVRTESPVTSELIERMVEFPREIHALLGIMTEAGELIPNLNYGPPADLDFHNPLEEVGDILWYVAILADAIGVKQIIAPQRNLIHFAKECGNRRPYKFARQAFFELIAAAGGMFDLYKKTIFYGKQLPSPEALRAHFEGLCEPLDKLCIWTGYSMSEVMEANIRKLRARYPEKFTEADAEDRDIDAEMDAMVQAELPPRTKTISAEEKAEMEKTQKDKAVKVATSRIPAHGGATSADKPAADKPPLCGCCHADALKPSPNCSGFWVCNQCGNLTAMPT